jgi:hypothetical protein
MWTTEDLEHDRAFLTRELKDEATSSPTYRSLWDERAEIVRELARRRKADDAKNTAAPV